MADDLAIRRAATVAEVAAASALFDGPARQDASRRFRGRGIGRRLVAALADLGREAGCYGMWVLTDDDNAAALAAYRAAGGVLDAAPRMLTWTFGAPA